MRSKTILNEIRRKQYDCLICDDTLSFRHKIWSCSSCFCVYHLACISKWSQKSADQEWRCPHCRDVQATKPSYRCWCGKEKNPDRNPAHPHSCGQTCGHLPEKSNCKHPCTDFCHPGPHKECTALGPVRRCYCGKKKIQKLCADSNTASLSCGSKCNKLLPCKVHRCKLECHPGGHKVCTETVEATCFCGKQTQKIPCSQAEYTGEIPKYSCQKICGHALDCGLHFCTEECHSGSLAHICKTKTQPGETCHCGKLPVTEILGQPRANCKEPIPSCRQVCGKIMPCKHKCESICHEGECLDCQHEIKAQCRCGSTQVTIKCGQDAPPLCKKKCLAKLGCTRHYCQEICCEFSSLSSHSTGGTRNRGRGRGRQMALTSTDDIMESAFNVLSLRAQQPNTSVHQCVRLCGKMLSCKVHTCEEQCHTGPCRPCLQAEFTDFVCPCGTQRIPAPIRCGTVIPPCQSFCHRYQTCGHPAMHKCHPDSKPCDPCTQLVDRKCVCGKMRLQTPCRLLSGEQEQMQCKNPCGRMLDCGHPCKIVCHDGPCPPCTSLCSRPFNCRANHTHQVQCHGQSPCGKCPFEEVATCACKTLKVTAACIEQVEIFCNQECGATVNLYNELVREEYELNPEWCRSIEHALIKFRNDSEQQVYWFKPMRRAERRVVHNIVECMGLVGESMDYGKSRSVRVRKSGAQLEQLPSIHEAIRLHRLFEYMGISAREHELTEDD